MQHEVGKVVEGKVTGITKFGAFVELEGGSVGMVHISEISQEYVNNISDYLKEQQPVKVKILNVSPDGKISLSIKRVEMDANNANRASRTIDRGSGNRNAAPHRPTNNGSSTPNNFKPATRGNANNYSGGNAKAASAAAGNNSSFEDMLSRFMKQSDERISDLKQPERRHGGYQRKDNRDYD